MNQTDGTNSGPALTTGSSELEGASWPSGQSLAKAINAINNGPSPCIGNDPACPCQDGLACHYRDAPGTKAWPLPNTAALQTALDGFAGRAEPSLAPPADSMGVRLPEGGGVDDDPIITTDMLRAQDLARIAELEGLLREVTLPPGNDWCDECGGVDKQCPKKCVYRRIESALAKGKT